MLCLEYIIKFSHNFVLEITAFVNNVSVCYSKPLIPVYKSMSDRDMICSLRRNKLNKMGKTVFQNQKVRELSRILDKQEVVVDDLVSS